MSNMTYTISFYLTEICNGGSQADIAVYMDDNPIGDATASWDRDSWQQCSFTWNSGAGTTVLVALKDLNTSEGWNDFAIANISMTAVQPELTLTHSGGNVTLTWPTNSGGFTLQSTTNPSSPTCSAVSPAPVVVNGQNTVTNSVSGAQLFYRLLR
jgi:hypothetical protein